MLAASVDHFQEGAFMQLTWSYVPGEGLWMSTEHRMRLRVSFLGGRWSADFFCKLQIAKFSV